jgi:hypothetical protein
MTDAKMKSTTFWVKTIPQLNGAVRFEFAPTAQPRATVWAEYRFSDGKFLSSGSPISKPILLPPSEGPTKVKFQTKDQPDEHFEVIKGVATRIYST